SPMSRNDLWTDYESFEADGDTWLPPGQAIKELGWSFSELYAAKERGCLLTNWEKLRFRRRLVGNRMVEFISCEQVDGIKKEKTALESSGPEKDEITFDEALTIAKCSPKTLRELVKNISTRRLSLSRSGRVSRRIFVSKTALLETLHAHRS